MFILLQTKLADVGKQESCSNERLHLVQCEFHTLETAHSCTTIPDVGFVSVLGVLLLPICTER